MKIERIVEPTPPSQQEKRRITSNHDNGPHLTDDAVSFEKERKEQQEPRQGYSDLFKKRGKNLRQSLSGSEPENKTGLDKF